MKIHDLLAHHGIDANPFAEEDAQTDPVFKQHCIASTYHPSWDKVFGDPSEPSTSIVFGEKGAGKTALKLQVALHLDRFNDEHPTQRQYVIHYDDFNPYLDRFRDRLTRRRRKRPDRVLSQWRLWDHMDAILSLGVTRLVDDVLRVGEPSDTSPSFGPDDLNRLDRHHRRDLLLLAACYDQSTDEPPRARWRRLRRALGVPWWPAKWNVALGGAVSAALLVLVIALLFNAAWSTLSWPWFYFWLVVGAAAGWGPWLWHNWQRFRLALGVVRNGRVLNRQIQPLRQVLMDFSTNQLQGQPLPNKDRTDDRYELFGKLQGVLGGLGYRGIVVLVDRVDEPHLINGSVELMRDLLWPMLDNKFLKQPGLALKLLLPIELNQFVEREDRDFYQRARLDKQNTVPSLQWTGESLYDVANARVKACAGDGAQVTLRDLFDETIGDRRMIEAFRSLRVPRHLFKFMYRVLMAHCNAHTDDDPAWKISGETFESVLALYSRDQDAFDRGVGAG